MLKAVHKGQAWPELVHWVIALARGQDRHDIPLGFEGGSNLVLTTLPSIEPINYV